MKTIPLLFAVMLALPGAAFARSPAPSPGPSASNPAAAPTATPSANSPHPTMPWSGGAANLYGQLMRYIVMPAQPVEITRPSSSAIVESRVVEIPGYTMTETTAGFYVPERWMLDQAGPGSYQWRLAPPQFFKK